MEGATQHPPPSAMRGMLLVVLAVGIFAVMDTIAKYLARSYPVAGVVWARYAANLVILLAFLAARGELRRLRTARPALQIMRGLREPRSCLGDPGRLRRHAAAFLLARRLRGATP